MSFSEIFIVLIVAILVLKPEDIPLLFKKVKEFYKYIFSIKKEIEKTVDKLSDTKESESEEINFYLKKIMASDVTYEGDYTLSDVKAFYHKLLLTKRIEKK